MQHFPTVNNCFLEALDSACVRTAQPPTIASPVSKHMSPHVSSWARDLEAVRLSDCGSGPVRGFREDR